MAYAGARPLSTNVGEVTARREPQCRERALNGRGTKPHLFSPCNRGLHRQWLTDSPAMLEREVSKNCDARVELPLRCSLDNLGKTACNIAQVERQGQTLNCFCIKGYHAGMIQGKKEAASFPDRRVNSLLRLCISSGDGTKLAEVRCGCRGAFSRGARFDPRSSLSW